MVTVARSFEAPVKLLFPQMTAGESPSMLGLGDIVIPGIFIALLLRYDYFQLRLPALTEQQIAASAAPFPAKKFTMDWEQKPFFWSTMTWYVIGLASTLGCMYFFKAAQPALLYLVPTCVGSSLFTAFRRNELASLRAYKEENSPVPTSLAEAVGTATATATGISSSKKDS